MDVKIYWDAYSTHDFLYRDYRQAFEKAKIEIRLPIAHEVLFDLTDRMDNIYRGMVDMAHRENVYGLYILYRSLIDHYVKIQYIFDRTATDNSDATAEQYQKHFFITEVLAEQMGVLQMEDLLNAVEKQTDFLDFIHTRFPEMKEFDKQNQKEISAAIKQFNMAGMIKHLTARYQQLPNNSGGGWIFASTLPEFSQVSSFTHGGAYAGQLMQSLSKDGKVDEAFHNKLHVGLTMLGVCKENAFIAYTIDGSFIAIIEEFQKARTIGPVATETTIKD